MPFIDHIEKTLKIDPGPTPGFKMLLSGLVITTPLIIGQINHELFVSMFGSLMALVLYLNDHFGSVIERIKHLVVTFIALMLSLAVGASVLGNTPVILVILFILSFLVGKSKDYGLELERMMLFIALNFLTASSEVVFYDKLQSLIMYAVLAFISYLVFAYLIFAFSHHTVSAINSKRATIKKIMEQNRTLKFPLACAIVSCVGYMLAQFFQFAHANWIVGTALIVMLPDTYQSIYKGVQRLLGTALGVILAAIVLAYIHDPKILIALVFLCAFLMPSGLSKNYWVANVYIAALILFFLEIAIPQSITEHHLAFWRIADIALGSLLGVIGAIIIAKLPVHQNRVSD